VLLAEEWAVLQGRTERMFEIVMGMNVEKTKVMRISSQQSPNTDCDGSRTAGDC
jgi:hypothetical protein